MSDDLLAAMLARQPANPGEKARELLQLVCRSWTITEEVISLGHYKWMIEADPPLSDEAKDALGAIIYNHAPASVRIDVYSPAGVRVPLRGRP